MEQHSTPEVRNRFEKKRRDIGLYESKNLIADSLKIRFALMALEAKHMITSEERIDHLNQLKKSAGEERKVVLDRIIKNY